MPTARKSSTSTLLRSTESAAAKKPAAKPAAKAAKSTSAASAKRAGVPRPRGRLFILDTNVLLHDPYCLFKFGEHDVFIPFVTVEELDGKKAGVQEVNRNARQATRLIEEVLSGAATDATLMGGFDLAAEDRGCSGKMFVQDRTLDFLPGEYVRKNDNLYLSVMTHLVKSGSHAQVVMVSKDLNLRIKAKALGFDAQDYLHDHAVSDADHVFSGVRAAREGELTTEGSCEVQRGGVTTTYLLGKRETGYVPNEFVILPSSKAPFRTFVDEEGEVSLRSCLPYQKDSHALMGLKSRNTHQSAAFDLLTDPNVDLVALLGIAGTGKTLTALAAALHQIIDKGTYDRLLFTRKTMPVGDEIGFLPGTEEDKMGPWLGALHDNIDVLVESQAEGAGSTQRLREAITEVVDIRAITFMRGRTFNRRFIIVDEAQNLTPKEMKTLITRAGEGTKIVCMGNLAQIDSPYLSETSNGLTYLVQRFKGWPHFGSIILEKGERSRLADAANERL